MKFRLTKRPYALLAVGATALLGATSGMVAAPARAADRVTLKIEAPETYVMYSADEGGKAFNNGFTVPVGVKGNGTEARDLKLTIDVSALSGTARLDNANCKEQNEVFTCEYGSPDDGESMTPFNISGVDGVKPGDGGTITYTATADNASPVTGSTRMRVGGPLLNLREHPAIDGVEPGGTARLTPAFANHSRYAADQGVGLEIHSSGRGLSFAREHDNCFYSPGRSDSAWCEFRTPIAPGTAYTTGRPFTVTADRSVISDSLVYEVSSQVEKGAEYTVKGKGAPLTLTRVADRGFGEENDPNSIVEVRTTQQADYRPVTATVKGRVGDTVRVTLGVRNAGPGDPGEESGSFEVIPPEGTTITSIPYMDDDDGPDWVCDKPKNPSTAYVCDLEADSFSPLTPGQETTIDFHIRIDKKISGAHGTIRAVGPFDRTHANDTAAIPVEASPAAQPTPLTVSLAAGAALCAVGALVVIRRHRANRS